MRDWPDDEPDVDLSNLGPDDAPELTDELAARLKPLDEVDPELRGKPVDSRSRDPQEGGR